MFRFNSEVLESMGFTVETNGPWTEIRGSENYLHLESVTERLFDSGCTENEVDMVCNDIVDIVNAKVIMRAMIDSCKPRGDMPRGKGHKGKM
jgi:hypothetical protein